MRVYKKGFKKNGKVVWVENGKIERNNIVYHIYTEALMALQRVIYSESKTRK